MASLSDEVKYHIVKALACFDTPTQVSNSVKEEFGLDVPRPQIALYNPTMQAGKHLSKKWRVLFEDTRKNFRDEVSEIPIASKAFRLRALARMAQQAEKMKNFPLAVQILEQSAKEAGDVFVNRKLDPVKLPGGGELPGGMAATVAFYLPSNGRDDDTPK